MNVDAFEFSLLKVGTIKPNPTGTVLIQAKAPIDGLWYVWKGRLTAWVGAQKVGSITRGQWCGEMSWLLGHNEASATVIADTPIECVYIARDTLEQFRKNEPEIVVELFASMYIGLASRLQGLNPNQQILIQHLRGMAEALVVEDQKGIKVSEVFLT